MCLQQQVRQLLWDVETILKRYGLWQPSAPRNTAFGSTQPFCLDTMQPLEWLQWVFLPRMHDLLDRRHPLPASFALVPYYDMTLESSTPGYDKLRCTLIQLDNLFNGAASALSGAQAGGGK